MMIEFDSSVSRVILSLASVVGVSSAAAFAASDPNPDATRATDSISVVRDAPAPDGDYPTYDEIVQEMMDAATNFPDICAFVDLTDLYGLPATVQGRHLVAVKISDSVGLDEDEPSFMMVSAHHGNEIITPVIALDAISRFTSEYGSDPRVTDAVDSYEIWIAPVWNPDGYVAGTRHNARDRDLNRDYPFGWEADGCTSGDAPLTEVETQTMIVWSEDQGFDKVLDYHSSGRETLHGYRCLEHPFDEYLIAEAIGLSEASSYGGDHRPPSADGEQYQWQLGAMGAYSFLTETGRRQQPDYSQALAEADRVWPGTLWMIERPIPLSGRVSDANTGAPLEASVRLIDVIYPNGEMNSSRGAHGRYSVFAPAGEYLVAYEKPGYEPVIELVSIDPEVELTLDVALTPDANRLIMEIDPFVSGFDATLRVVNATPNETAYFAYSLGGFGLTPVPELGVSLSVVNARLGATAVADGTGLAEATALIPPSASTQTVYLQAAQVGRVSNVVVELIE
ncbi:MAG: M14 family zinc carboxypeptidase [Phycisphaerales bacterium]